MNNPKTPTNRAAFLRESSNLLTGFDLETGKVSEVWQRAYMGEFETPEGMDEDADHAVLGSLHARAGEVHRDMAATLSKLFNDADPSLTRESKTMLAAKLVEPRLAALAEAAASQLARVDARIAEEEAQLEAAMKPDALGMSVMHDSIRRHALEHGANLTKLSSGEVDYDTLIAIAAAPAYLSGVIPTVHGLARAHLAKRVDPDRVNRITAIKTAKQRALMSLAALDKVATRLIDFKGARALETKAREARARHGAD